MNKNYLDKIIWWTFKLFSICGIIDLVKCFGLIVAECKEDEKSAPMGDLQISERALRPMIYEKDETVVQKSRQQIV